MITVDKNSLATLDSSKESLRFSFFFVGFHLRLAGGGTSASTSDASRGSVGGAGLRGGSGGGGVSEFSQLLGLAGRRKKHQKLFFKIRSLSIKNGKTWHSLLVDALDLVLVALRCEPIQDEPDEKENKIGTRTASTIRKTIQSTRESGFVFLVEPLARSSKDS